ncbi:MAG: FAD-dependent oxidoreductase [Syntrophobacteria bacterium]
MAEKVGIYVCHCGSNIAGMVDVESVAKWAGANIKDVAISRDYKFMCSSLGQQMIQDDIKKEGLTRVVVAACSRRVLYDVFNFGPGVIVERVNLREGVVWSHKPVEEGEEAPPDLEHPYELIQEMAEDYLRMGIARAQRVAIPEPYEAEINRRILVMGGGISGLSAALDVAKAGYEVTLVEKEPQVGGFAAKWRKQTPWSPPYEEVQDPVIGKIIREAEAHEKIEIRTSTEVARIAGAPGSYELTFKEPNTKSMWDVPRQLTVEEREELEKAGEEAPEAGALTAEEATPDNPASILVKNPDAEIFGAVILATGWKPDDPTGYEHLGYGRFPNVITNVALEEMAARGKITRPSDGKSARSVAFIQSPGQGSDEDFPYASTVTSMVALKQAKYVREDNPEAKAYIFYQHMRTLGVNEYFYQHMQQDEGVFMTKGDVISVSGNGDGMLELLVNDTLLGENIKVNVDMVVLGTGMVPTTRDEPVLNLAYRQGRGFLDLDLFDGYADSNFICFPYETRRTGIYTVGAVRRSMSIPECIEDAAGAALKAIQCLESANRGVAVHPRSGDMTYPDFYFQRCTQCKRCTDECPFGALDDDVKGTPLPNPTRCRRCGICMGACPERIINFADYSIDSVSSMIKAIEVPEEDEEKPRVVILACENDAYPSFDICGINRLTYSPYVRIIPVRCLGSVNVVWIKDSLSKGIDGILMIGCKFGDDYHCHMIKGSELADIRMDKIGEALKSLALEKERVQQEEVAIDEYDRLPEIIGNFMETIEEVGPNPFKGF